jgi:NAD(P)-dependent dehydrogenase (short-subunit alcohol dehydrogenase family)
MDGRAAERPAVVITGASSGIGRACALELARRGFRVFAAVRRAQDAEALRAEAPAEGLTPINLEVTDPASIALAARTVEEALGDRGLDGLINNAGVSASGPLEFLELDELRHHLEVNLVGQVAVTQAFLPLVRKRPGRIVFTGSMGGYLALPFLGPYAASKHALEAIADSLRRELRPWGIEVCLLEPGAIQSRIWEKGTADGARQINDLPARAAGLYRDKMEKLLALSERTAARAIGAEAVARVVHHALTAARPRTRYRVGPDAKFGRFATRWFPDRWVDRLVDRLAGLS